LQERLAHGDGAVVNVDGDDGDLFTSCQHIDTQVGVEGDKAMGL
jgi:hypothetical protein